MRTLGIILGIAISIVGLLPDTGATQEMRAINPIPTPAPLPPGTTRVASPQPLDPGGVRVNVEQFMSKWNDGDLGGMIAENFYEKSRFEDAMLTNVPRDARVKVQGIGGVQTMQQVVVDDPAGGRVRVTTGSAMVRTQIEFNDPKQGFVKVPGTNEVIFEIIQKER